MRHTTSPEKLTIGGQTYSPESRNATTFFVLDGVVAHSAHPHIQIIRGLKAKGLGVLISDHNVRETLQVCDFAYIMNNGQILTSGVAEDIIQSSVARKMYLGDNFRM